MALPAKRTPTIADVLLRAAEYVERGWTQGTGARSAKGRRVVVTGRAAVCWCAEGAIHMAARDNEETIWQARTVLLRVLPDEVTSIMDWNDAPSRTQAEVVDALRRAAKACEQRAA